MADRLAANGIFKDAAAAYSQAISLWHDPLLGNVESETFREALMSDLAEQYLDTAERWADMHLRARG
jgi:hypothetical protein